MREQLNRTFLYHNVTDDYIKSNMLTRLNTLAFPQLKSAFLSSSSSCPPVTGGEARPSIVCVLCPTRWLLGMSHLTGSDCQQEQNVIMSGGCCGPATIIGNSSPQVMMIMEFAANDFG